MYSISFNPQISTGSTYQDFSDVNPLYRILVLLFNANYFKKSPASHTWQFPSISHGCVTLPNFAREGRFPSLLPEPLGHGWASSVSGAPPPRSVSPPPWSQCWCPWCQHLCQSYLLRSGIGATCTEVEAIGSRDDGGGHAEPPGDRSLSIIFPLSKTRALSPAEILNPEVSELCCISVLDGSHNMGKWQLLTHSYSKWRNKSCK